MLKILILMSVQTAELLKVNRVLISSIQTDKLSSNLFSGVVLYR